MKYQRKFKRIICKFNEKVSNSARGNYYQITGSVKHAILKHNSTLN